MADVGGNASRNGGHSGILRRMRECSMLVKVGDVKKVKAYDIIKAVVETCGEGAIEGCVLKSADVYEVTLADKESLNMLLPELTVNDQIYQCEGVVNDSVVVSFLNLPLYVSDAQIEDKLESMGVELLGPIRRRKHKDTYMNIECNDGTRYVKVKFPPGLSSLPYSMKFFDGKNYAYYRVIHNNQMKVCNQCLSEDHVFKNCPDNICRKCGYNGHLARECKAIMCDKCLKYGTKCNCTDDISDMSDDESEAETEGCDECHRPLHACSCPFLCDGCGKFECSCDSDNVEKQGNVSDPAVGPSTYDDGNEHHSQMTSALQSTSELISTQSTPVDLSVPKKSCDTIPPLSNVSIPNDNEGQSSELLTIEVPLPGSVEHALTPLAVENTPTAVTLPTGDNMPTDVRTPPTAVTSPPAEKSPTVVTPLPIENLQTDGTPQTDVTPLDGETVLDLSTSTTTDVISPERDLFDDVLTDNNMTASQMEVEQGSRRRRLVGYDAVNVNSKIRRVRDGETD